MTTTLLSILAAVVLAVLVVAFWGLTVLGLPGNWINAILVAGYGWLIPDNWRVDVGWPWIVACFALAAVGEAIEFVAGAVGTSRAGGSRRSAAGAIVGSLVGGIGGAFVALPIPIAGPLVGAILFGGVGAAVGAAVAEKWNGSHITGDDSCRREIRWCRR